MTPRSITLTLVLEGLIVGRDRSMVRSQQLLGRIQATQFRAADMADKLVAQELSTNSQNNVKPLCLEEPVLRTKPHHQFWISKRLKTLEQ